MILAALPQEVEAFPDEVPVWTTGPGKVNAAYGISQMLQARPDFVVVVGTAAGIRLPRGLYRPGWARQWDATSLDGLVGQPVSPPDRLPIPQGDPGLVISTGDSFVTEPGTPLTPGQGRSLVDMETYVYVYFLTMAGVDFRVLKVVTDAGDGAAGVHWRERLPAASQTLFEAVMGEFL
jgi:adenosylhomocysteine nucleosidase